MYPQGWDGPKAAARDCRTGLHNFANACSRATAALQCAHIMAMAVQRLYKDARVTIGPWTERGFYYDFDMKETLTDKELKAIRKEMQKIVKANLPFVREEVRTGMHGVHK